MKEHTVQFAHKICLWKRIARKMYGLCRLTTRIWWARCFEWVAQQDTGFGWPNPDSQRTCI